MVSLNLSRDELRAKLIADVFVLILRRALLLLLRVVLIRVGVEDEIEERALETIALLFVLLLVLLLTLIPLEIDLLLKPFKILTQFELLAESELLQEMEGDEEHTIGTGPEELEEGWLVLAFFLGRYL